MLYNFIKNINAFIDELKSIEDDDVEANNDPEMDENELELEIDDLNQREKESGSDESNVDI